MSDRKCESLPVFRRASWEGGEVFTRLGTGGIGGKAAGLLLLQKEFLPHLDREDFPGLQIGLPRSVVIGTSMFEAFMDLNDLWDLVGKGPSDERIADAFRRAHLPPELVGDLRDLVSQIHTPLAVRSSSLLEDDLDHPFAGIYSTKMIPNNQPDTDSRYRCLDEAIRFVYATTYFSTARDYFRATGLEHDRERMAILIQEMVGNRHGDRLYPEISGVCRSFNYYPSGAARPTDGVVNLALGLGRQIVDGGLSWGYCPAYPATPPPFNDLGDRMYNTQKDFWAVNMGTPPPPDPMGETEFLLQCDLAQAEQDGVLDRSVSTYDAGSDRLRLGMVGKGPRILDYGPLLVGETLPVNDLLREAIPLAERTLGCPVEMEFAMDRGDDGLDRFCLLQLRPMAIPRGDSKVTAIEMNEPDLVMACERALGHGVKEGIRDVVFVKPESFDFSRSREVAQEVDALNRELFSRGRPYVLIGFGRWGSSDPWLGIPVHWGQINGAAVIVEAPLGGPGPDPSQGAHFFHNLIAEGTFYLTIQGGRTDRIDWEWLQGRPVASSGRYTCHVRLENALQVRVDGLAGFGLVREEADR